MDWLLEGTIRRDVDRINVILGVGIFEPENITDPLMFSAFTELMVCLNDLLQKCRHNKVSVEFTDNVDIDAASEIFDVTGLVRTVRNIVCHTTSPQHRIPEGSLVSYNVLQGNIGMDIQGRKISSEIYDDTCFQFGIYRIYLNHHIIRAFEEAKQKLSPLLDAPL